MDCRYQLSKYEIESILPYVLTEFCDMSVLGFNQREGKYWCKKYENECLKLYMELTIDQVNSMYSKIQLVPVIWTKDELCHFVNEFNDTFIMYRSSNFIKSILTNKLMT